MSYLLFLDESGIDRRTSPYEVLAGVAIHDQRLWSLIQRVQQLEKQHFGDRISSGPLELKAKKLIKRKTFRIAAQGRPFEMKTRTRLARACLVKGQSPATADDVTSNELVALAQAKIAFCESVLDACQSNHVRAFASIVPRTAHRPDGNFLRKDYSYLFQRFFYFLEDQHPSEPGLVIFDELERSRCHLLIEQMRLYFQDTHTGRSRSHRVIPEPFFVHSELTTAIQLADLVAYIICWGVRFGTMRARYRSELESVVSRVLRLRYRTERSVGGVEAREFFSFSLIRDLRPKNEKDPG